uniref:Uncharacterized protein n=1 Tax=Siphoviridae sp. ctDOT22 TaxID=2827812 RepID=A0A8S5SVU0_9CAUD|nr:MAG TPA: hypothetical protein [Siphoviridae sp. ctDOT22]
MLERRILPSFLHELNPKTHFNLSNFNDNSSV